MKDKYNQLHQEFLKKLESFAAAQGVKLNAISARSDGFELKYSLTFKSLDKNVLREEFETYAAHVGLMSGLYNKSFDREGETYTIVEIKTSARKYKVITERASGGQSGFTVDGINALVLKGAIK